MNTSAQDIQDISLKIGELIRIIKGWAVLPDSFGIQESLMSYGVSSVEYIQLVVDVESAFSVELDDQYLEYSDDITCEVLAQAIVRHIT